jgi:Ras-related protein Rab-7A
MIKNFESPNRYKKEGGKLCKTVVLMGTNEVGKTCILLRLCKKRYEESYKETIGVDYYSKEITIGNNTNSTMLLSLWDTSGNELEYKILPSNIYKTAACYIITCSYDSKESMENIKSWIDHILKFQNKNNNNMTQLSTNNHPLIILLINKSDLHSKDRKFKISDVIRIVDEYINLNISTYEVSAKENKKLDFVFEKIAGVLCGLYNSVTLTEYSLDSTKENNLSAGRIRNNNDIRRKSFQLQPKIVEIFPKNDRESTQHSSCCK